MQVINEIPVFGYPVDDHAVAQMTRCGREAVKAALMADHHLGYSMPIGGVVAYRDAVSPSGVGYDIGCGNMAVRLNLTASDIRPRIAVIMDEVVRVISFGVGRTNNERVDHWIFDDDLWKLKPAAQLKEMARQQLGTVGSGNHYVDIFLDETDRVWVGVHFGSRGLGHKLATYFLEAAGAVDAIDAEPCILRKGEAIFDDYLAAMKLAGDYAFHGREWVCERLASLLGGSIVESVHNHHNYAWYESHGGENLWVVRKGATPAWPGQRGFIGGSMCDISVIIEGVDHPDAEHTLRSTVHGAGRHMGRSQAKGKYRKNGECVRPGLVTPAMMQEAVSRAGIELRGADLDESPHCYKRLPEVLAHHSTTIKVLHTLRPIGVAMAGKHVSDPYKD